MGYWAYYLLVFFAYWAVDHPAVLVLLLVFFIARRWVPDPLVFFRTMGHISRLKEQIAANPSNVTARRDLARIYLQRLRPGAALRLLEQALERDADSPELLFLRGQALHRTGRHEEALSPLVEAVAKDPRVGFGEAYRVAGDALRELERADEAVDAYERFLKKNSSSVEGYTKLALAHRGAKDEQAAKESLAEGLRTFGQLPGYKRRAELGWYLRAQVLRLFI